MKRQIAFLLLSVQFAWGQNPAPELSWTFQWGAEPCGLLFGDADLPSGVKAAIRDDIKRVYQVNPQSNTVSRLYLPGDEKYGQFTGVVWFERTTACPEEIQSLDYRVYGGANYSFIAEPLCSVYAAKVALTNQHPAAIGSLADFLHSVNHMSASNTTSAAFAQMWWRFKKGRAGALADDTPQSFAEGIQSISDDRYYCLSLLAVWERAPSYWNALSTEPPIVGCTIKALPKSGGDHFDEVSMDAIYKDGQWRFVAWE
jgi:hypothetical protein